MSAFLNFSKKLWSWLSPRTMEVRLLSQALPSGQLEVWPEYWLDGRRIEGHRLHGSAHQAIDGYRVRIPPAARGLQKEFQGKRLRLRPHAVADWIRKYAAAGVTITDHATGRPVQSCAADVEFDLQLRPDDTLEAKATLSTPDGVELDAQNAERIPDEDGWYRLDDTIFERPSLSPDLNRVISAGEPGLTLQGDAVPDFLSKLEENTGRIRGIRRNPSLDDQTVFHTPPANKLRVDGDDEKIVLNQSLVYEGAGDRTHEESLADAEELLRQRGSRQGYRRLPKGWVRVRSADTESARRARRQLPGEAAQRDFFQGAAIPEVLSALADQVRRGSPWNVYVSGRVRERHGLIDEHALVRFKLSVVDVDGAESLLQLDPLYQHQKQELHHPEIAAAIQGNERWVRRPRSWVKIDRETFAAVEQAIQHEHLTPREGGFTFPASERERVLESLLRLGKVEQTESYAEFARKLLEFQGIEHTQPPISLCRSVKFYDFQQHGYNWLAFLRRFGLNGILADDMGLGKTLQALAVIRHSREVKARGSQHPSLIICPVSVMANWEAEARRFFPGCGVVQYRGPNRDAVRSTMYWSDFVLVSYSVAASDWESLSDIPWNYVVLDEAHAIRNPAIQRTQGVKRIGGLHKLALTGTPVQNTAVDIWSIFDFLMPGYLGSLNDFRAKYPALFDRKSGAFGKQADGLRRRAGPFVLRRLKKDVAQDLPEKILADRVVELTDEQVRLYRGLLAGQEARRLRESIERNDFRREHINILQLLMRLRHICNHPALESNDGNWGVATAAKLSALEELLEEIVVGEHRALIFSQFTMMLDIIERCLPEWGIRALRIDGSTPPPLRQRFAVTFNEDISYHCMLLSTKAAGLGLNLAGADTVIFYDHDWNPANDEQAQDRAYRIGQTRNVTVYRLITKGTIEEKILRYQQRKRELAQALVDVDTEGFKDLTREELLSLFTLDV